MELYECINFLLTNTQNAVSLHFKHKLQPFGITPTQYAVLNCLWSEDNQTPTALAASLHLDTSTITGILTRMEAKELLSRSFSQADRRRVIVHILPKGMALRESVMQVLDDANQELLSELSPDAVAQCKTLLQQIEKRAKSYYQEP